MVEKGPKENDGGKQEVIAKMVESFVNVSQQYGMKAGFAPDKTAILTSNMEELKDLNTEKGWDIV